MRILVTGFEPFGGAAVNPSARLVEALGADPPAGMELRTAVLPVAYARARPALAEAVRGAQAEAVVCFGQADGRARITVERVALNLDDAEAPDNEGVVSTAPITPAGPAAYWSTLPVELLVGALRAHGIPSAASRDAGGFLCNHVFYSLMELAAGELPKLMAGFVHVPLLPEQTLAEDLPSMPFWMLLRAGRIVLDVLAEPVGSGRARGLDHGARTPT
ncbi:MAG: pyroglutamyl-peptidase I [Gaiellaceae bacterium]